MKTANRWFWLLVIGLFLLIAASFLVDAWRNPQTDTVPIATSTVSLPSDLCDMKGVTWLNKKCS